jgi:hypothetical protein
MSLDESDYWAFLVSKTFLNRLHDCSRELLTELHNTGKYLKCVKQF